jgi:hypothetical protein
LKTKKEADGGPSRISSVVIGSDPVDGPLIGALPKVVRIFAPPLVFPAGSYATRSVTATVASTAGPIQTQQAGDLAITVQVLPARVNATNTVIVTISERPSGTLVTDAQVQLSINMEVMDMGTRLHIAIPLRIPLQVLACN